MVAATPVPVAIEPPAAPVATGVPADAAAPAPAVVAPVLPPPAAANPNARTVHEFQGDEVAMVLRLLARQAGINIMVSDQIQGTVNMRVENLTPLEAIKVIVDAKGLDMSQVNNVYFVKTAAEKAKEPTESGCYTFSYAATGVVKAGEANKGEMVENDRLKSLIASQIQSGIIPQIDIRTNTVFFRDYKSNINNIMLFLESLDRPTQQVMIEARLVEVNANPKQSYGINWAGTLGGAGNAQNFKFAGSGLRIENGLMRLDPITGNMVPGDGTVLSDILLAGPGGDFASALAGQFAILSVPQMNATLRLMNEDTDAEFLANPRVVTANNLKANIKITTKQPVPKLKFNEQTASTTFDSFEEKEYGNVLEVTPTINKDSFVTMLVKPEISNKVRDEAFTIGGAIVRSPVIDTRALESNVLIKSGDTLAIGGLLQDESTKTRAKVPVLGDIPVLGYLFQERLNARAKRNLLVFITPTIIKPGYGTGLEDQVSGLKNSGEEFADPNGWRNNAKGAIRMVPTANRQNAADYPKPGTAPAPMPVVKKKTVQKFKVTVPEREQ
jgi:type IV pilus assembly protein PilQ